MKKGIRINSLKEIPIVVYRKGSRGEVLGEYDSIYDLAELEARDFGEKRKPVLMEIQRLRISIARRYYYLSRYFNCWVSIRAKH
jgi:hypothetical protein